VRAVTAIGIVHPNHTLTVPVPEDIAPGTRTVVVVLEDDRGPPPQAFPLTFSPHPVGPADPSCTYRREDVYGDGGR
jgi:hypothetical protein